MQKREPNVLGWACFVITVIAAIAAVLVVPEFRVFFRLDKPAAAVIPIPKSDQPPPAVPSAAALPKEAKHAPAPKPRMISKSGVFVSQHSEGPNSPNTAVIGDNNHVTVNPDPTAPVMTYLYDGDQRISRPGLITDNPENAAARMFKRITSAHTSNDWPLLLSLCNESITETPEWLTPHLYRGEAYANLGRFNEAVVELEDAKKKAAGNQDYDLLITHADELLQKIHQSGH